jgi:uncharacterized OsmC-like protein
MKIILVAEDAIRLEGAPGPLTIEAPTAGTTYSPFHMLGSSLALCTYSVLASWGSTVGIDHEGLAIEVGWAFADKPHRVSSVSMHFDWPTLPARRLETAKRVATLCPIHATLHHETPVAIDGRAGSVDDGGVAGGAPDARAATSGADGR